MKPFLKWAGGKTQLLPEILARIPDKVEGTFYEPFLGGGAVFFALAKAGRIRRAILSDINKDLVNAYYIVQVHPEELITELKKYTNTEECYYETREQFNKGKSALVYRSRLTLIDRAAKFIYLNKCCYNGLYRENKKGEFNSPFGHRKKVNICDEQTILECSQALQIAVVCCSDELSDELISTTRCRDFVYLDPPYVPVNETSFTQYHSSLFDNQCLAKIVKSFLRDRSIPFLLSNSDTPVTRQLYDGFKIESVSARRAINRDASKRGCVSELLISAS